MATPEQLVEQYKKSGAYDKARERLIAEFMESVSPPCSLRIRELRPQRDHRTIGKLSNGNWTICCLAC